jgi:hypothetical protein
MLVLAGGDDYELALHRAHPRARDAVQAAAQAGRHWP